MKTIIKLALLFNLLFSLTSTASHIKGGEITWQCQGNGQYVFYLKIYRDCNGIPLGWNSYTINVLGNPNLTSFPVNLFRDNDLTPQGCGNSCNQPNGYFGALEEFIFKSAPITLTGVPPSTGWIFYWDGDCCRSLVDNIIQGTQMILHAAMFPHNGMDANPCYDSSPTLAEKPIPAICIGYPFTYNVLGYDADHDSLIYKFDYAYDNGTPGNGLGLPLQFLTPYSVNNPIPGNPIIDSHTGEFSFYPQGAVLGNYSMVIKTSAYRCGNLISEVNREVQVTLHVNGCSGTLPVAGSTTNNPPSVSPAPFVNPLTGLYTSYIDTVNVGDTVDFTLSVTEFQQAPIAPNAFQSFWIDVVGAEMDTNSIAPYTDCPLPPCAHLDTPTPQGPFQVGHQTHFRWITDCAHPFNSCGKEYTPYYFVVNVKDDACPVGAQNNITVTVVVRGLEIIKNGDTLTVNTPYTNLQWYFNGTAIPGANSNMYVMTLPGDYEVTALTQIGCEVSSSYRLAGVSVGNIEINTPNQLTLAPNPVSSLLKITLPITEQELYLTVTDNMGKKVLNQSIKLNSEHAYNLNTSVLQNGIYYLTLDGKENSWKQRFVVLR